MELIDCIEMHYGVVVKCVIEFHWKILRIMQLYVNIVMCFLYDTKSHRIHFVGLNSVERVPNCISTSKCFFSTEFRWIFWCDFKFLPHIFGSSNTYNIICYEWVPIAFFSRNYCRFAKKCFLEGPKLWQCTCISSRNHLNKSFLELKI